MRRDSERGCSQWLFLLGPSEGSAASVDFGREVQPILSDRCFACHGPDEAQRQAGLRLDLRDAAVAPTQSGRVPVRPGDPDGSELLRRVMSIDPATRMPPAYMGHSPLDADEVDALRRWIEGGAEYEVHWAFRPPDRPPKPDVSDPDWAREGLDAFVLARLDSEQLLPSGEASPETWLRRMRLDLNGLPPTLEETRAFVLAIERDAESAYEDAVETALASPRYGERMAMDWLDVARYADTHGFNNDSERSMWRWRDWVIEAFNRNLPYDDFIVEQVAGDLLPDPTIDQLIATGFNRNHVINSEGGIIEEEYRVEYVADRVRTLGMAWLGLTIECARCHDHKFDPVSQEDYYRFFAFFDNVPEMGEAGRVANAVPMMPAPTAGQRRSMEVLRSRILALERRNEETIARWEPSLGAVGSLESPEYPANAEFFLGCDDSELDGIAGRACRSLEIEPEEEFKARRARGIHAQPVVAGGHRATGCRALLRGGLFARSNVHRARQRHRAPPGWRRGRAAHEQAIPRLLDHAEKQRRAAATRGVAPRCGRLRRLGGQGFDAGAGGMDAPVCGRTRARYDDVARRCSHGSQVRGTVQAGTRQQLRWRPVRGADRRSCDLEARAD